MAGDGVRHPWRIALAALVIAALAGCGGTVAGTATRETSSAAAAVSPGSLDPGTYPTSARAPLGVAGTEDAGRLVEGRRMAGYVAGPWQADPGLIGVGPAAAVVLERRDQIWVVVWPSMLSRFPPGPFIVGFTCDRRSADPKDPTSLRDAVLRYADPGAAAAAARGLVDGAMNMPVFTGSTQPVPAEPARAVPIPGHPEATGVLYTRPEGANLIRDLTVVSARGPYLLIQVVSGAAGPDRAAELAGRTLDLQVPLIEQFQPTDPAQFATLALDPTGLLARTVPLKPGQGDSMSNGTYDRAGALRLEDNPIQAGRAFDDAGVDVVAVSQTTVYQAADGDGAERLARALGDDTAARPASQPASAVPGLPQSRCVRIDDSGGLIPKHWCIATAGRYAFKAVARQLDNAHQQMAAQYLMLGG